jgi:peptidyl-prolyl cis-trans isomerase SurA
LITQMEMTLSTARGALALAALAALAASWGVPAQAQGLQPSPPRTLTVPALPVAPAATSQRAADFIVAVVNSEPITNNEVRAQARQLAQQLAQARRPAPSDAELGRAVLERLISDKAQLQLARDTGIRIDNQAVDQAELSVAQQNQIDVPELRKRLAQEGISLAPYRETLRDQLALMRLREREVDARVRVSDLEVEQFMREHAANPQSGAIQINIAQILVAVPENATPEQLATLQAKAQSILQRARANEDFAALAREFSDAPDRANGGQLGLRSADRVPPLFLEATQALTSGDVTGPVRSGAGFHVLKVLEKGAAGMTVVQQRARHILLRSSAQLNESQAREKLSEFKRRVEAGLADFATLARTNSQDASAPQGGDLGWASPGQFVPEFERVMNALQPGQISEPLVSRFGMHLIQLQERRTTALTKSQQQEVVRSQLRDKKLDEAFLLWVQEVRGRAFVEFREPVQL